MYVSKTRNPEANFNFSNATSFEVFENNAVSSTTSSAFQDKLSITSQSDIPGKYVVQWFMEIANSSNNQQTLVRVEWKPTSSGVWTIITDVDAFIGRSEVYDAQSGFRVIQLVSTDTIDVRVSYAAGGSTARIRNVNVYLFRVELS